VCDTEDFHENVIYISDDNNLKIDGVTRVAQYDKNIDFLNKKPIIIEEKFIHSLKDKIMDRYNAGYKTIIIKDTLDKNDIREYLGLSFNQHVSEKPKKHYNPYSDSLDITETFQIATVIQFHDGFDIVSSVSVSDESEISKAIEHTLKYDHTKLIESDVYTSSSRENYNWSAHGNDSDNAYADGVYAASSLQVWKCGPDTYGDYYLHSKVLTDATSDEGYQNVEEITNCISATGPIGEEDPTILEYGPPNQTITDGSSVSFTLSYGIGGISFSPNTERLKITRVGGGISDNYVNVEMKPRHWLYGDWVTDVMRHQVNAVKCSPFEAIDNVVWGDSYIKPVNASYILIELSVPNF